MQKSYFYAIYCVILLVSSCVRLVNLESNPAWYTDEGTHVEIARHLVNGDIRYLALKDSFLIAARLPLFEYLLALCFRLFSPDIVVLRMLTAWLGVVTTALVYRVVMAGTQDRQKALFAMALFAVYPTAVIYSRFGFSYNLLPVLHLIGLWCFLRFQIKRHNTYFVWGCLLWGLATISDFVAFAFLPPIILWLLLIRPRLAFYGSILMVLPFFIYSCVELARHPEIFLFDLSYTLRRTSNLPIGEQILNLQTNIEIMFKSSIWIPLSILGMFFIRPLRLGVCIGLLMVLPIFLMGRTVALYNLSAYYLIPSLPFFVISVAFLIYDLLRILSNIVVNYFKLPIFAISAISLFIGLTVDIGFDAFTQFNTGVEHFLVKAHEGRQIQGYLVDYAKPDDIIIISPTLAWTIEVNVTDYQLAILSQGVDAVHFPKVLYPDRFAFDPNYHRANFAVVDTLWRDWGAVHMPAVAEMLDQISRWNLVYETSTIQIYQNPET